VRKDAGGYGEYEADAACAADAEFSVLISKKGKVTIKKKQKKAKMRPLDLNHNRKKQYILQEGVPVPFLQDLGVMTEEGKIVHARFDKFRQINRFLEFIEDILPQLDSGRELTILDFGCGKSYLTFAMYYYLHELKSYDIRIIGLDLKTDVIRKCNELAKKYQYDKLTFLEGNIADYTGAEEVDMVVTLHACDTATDFALAKAIGWNAKVILSVPCCQHELNRQMKNDVLSPIMNYGLLKERMAALVTDGLRAEYLKREGYDVQVLEFIDMEHTPKNILLRAVKTGRRADNEESIRACETFLRVTPTLGRLLDEKGEL
jgi:SAM-dependent methyltransferase